MTGGQVLGVGAGVSCMGIALWVMSRKAEATAARTEAAVASGGMFRSRLTGYWPFSAKTEAERRMEGGRNDRKGKRLHTLEQHMADPVRHPYVSVAGDDAIFPYGQRILIDAWPNAVFRVVDTGGNFRGVNKVYRVQGLEPLDICVNTKLTSVPKPSDGVLVRIVKGDHFDKPGKEVATSKFKGQSVVGQSDLELLGADMAHCFG